MKEIAPVKVISLNKTDLQFFPKNTCSFPEWLEFS